MTQVELHHGAASDVGLLRQNNEDAYLVAPPVFVVADGMGGHESGDVASRIVVEEFARLVDEGYEPTGGTEAVTATLQASQRRIAEYAGPEGPGPRRTPGTTVVPGERRESAVPRAANSVIRRWLDSRVAATTSVPCVGS